MRLGCGGGASEPVIDGLRCGHVLVVAAAVLPGRTVGVMHDRRDRHGRVPLAELVLKDPIAVDAYPGHLLFVDLKLMQVCSGVDPTVAAPVVHPEIGADAVPDCPVDAGIVAVDAHAVLAETLLPRKQVRANLVVPLLFGGRGVHRHVDRGGVWTTGVAVKLDAAHGILTTLLGSTGPVGLAVLEIGDDNHPPGAKSVGLLLAKGLTVHPLRTRIGDVADGTDKSLRLNRFSAGYTGGEVDQHLAHQRRRRLNLHRLTRINGFAKPSVKT